MNQTIQYFSIDHLIVYTFLGMVLLIGLLVGRNIKNMRDYAIADKAYGLSVLIVTMLATQLGGGTTIGLGSAIFSDGIIAFVAALGCVFAYLFIVKFIASKIKYFEGSITMGDIMEKLYGKRGKVITGIIGFSASIFLVASQSLSLGYVFEVLLGIERSLGVAIGGFIVVAYAAFGGIKSVIITDVIQFTLVIVMLPLIASFAVTHVGGMSELLAMIPTEKFIVFQHQKFTQYLVMFLIWGGVFPIVALRPSMVQRILMSQDKRQVAQMFNIGIPVTITFNVIVVFIAFTALVLYPDITPSTALPQVIHHLLPIGLKGLAITGLLAIIMSTADSELNAAGILFAHDVIKPIFDHYKRTVNELRFTKYFTLFIGFSAVIVAMRSDSVVNLVFYGFSLLGALVTTPFIAGIVGLKIDFKSFLIALLIALVTLGITYWYLPLESHYLVPLWGILANFSSFFIVHFIQNHGFVFVHSVQQDTKWQKINLWYIWYQIVKTIPTPKKIFNYSIRKVANFGASYNLFAIFFCLNFIVPYFMWTYQKPTNYTIMLIMRSIAALLCVGILLRAYWPSRFKKYLPIYWHITLMYCLPVLTTTMFLLSGGNPEWLINSAMAIMLLAVLVDWITFLLLSTLGIFIGFLLRNFFIHLVIAKENSIIFQDFSTLYLLIYVVVFSTLIGVIFLRKKDNTVQRQLALKRLLGGAIAHEVNNTIGMTYSYATGLGSMLKTAYAEKYPKEKNGKALYLIDKDIYDTVMELPKTLKEQIAQGYQIIDMLLVAVRSSMKDAKDIGLYSIKTCVQEAIEVYVFDDDQKENISVYFTNDFKVNISKFFLMHTFLNLIKNAHKYAGNTCKIEIWCKNNTLHFKDDGPGIPQESLPYIFDPFYTNYQQDQIRGTGIGLAFCKEVVDTFGGTIACQSKQGKGSYTAFILAFPQV